MAQRKKRDAQTERHWRRMDLHLHTPASSDFQEPNISFLDILHKAEVRGMDLIAFTDHNSVAGYARMLREMERLEWLEKLKRLNTDEKRRLEEYRRLRQKILVLPGFEFTATFGFHILGVFSDKTSVRAIEHILLNLNVPEEKLDSGPTEVGATNDVLTAYRLIDEAGGIVIAAHVNSSHGVAMRGIDFGGQTKIAYTQDSHLHALEVTDLDSKSKRSTANFFSGIKPEYPRRMHCLQGSDSHRLNRDQHNPKNLGAFDRVTEVMLPELSFEALRAVLRGNDFSLTRAARFKADEPYDALSVARRTGPGLTQAFHEAYSQRAGKLTDIVADVCAFANTNGGTLFIGMSAQVQQTAPGIASPKQAMESIRKAVQKSITPPIELAFVTHEAGKAKVLQVNVPRGEDVPYAVDKSQIYVRQEAETVLAGRDEILQIVQRRSKPVAMPVTPVTPKPTTPTPVSTPKSQPPAKQSARNKGKKSGKQQPAQQPAKPIAPTPVPATAAPEANATADMPHTGVEIVESETRGGQTYHTVRDLRNGSVVRNVTRKSARKLWHYAISQHEQHPADASAIKWLGDAGLLSVSRRAGAIRYDLVLRHSDGHMRVFYGVTDDGLQGVWRSVADLDDGSSIKEETTPEAAEAS